MPTLSPGTNQATLPGVLEPYLHSKPVFKCPSDNTYYDKYETSYEWNSWLNGAPYDRPEEWSDVTKGIVDMAFGGRLNTPLAGDVASFHAAGGPWTGKNALYFEGRVERTRLISTNSLATAP